MGKGARSQNHPQQLQLFITMHRAESSCSTQTAVMGNAALTTFDYDGAV